MTKLSKLQHYLLHASAACATVAAVTALTLPSWAASLFMTGYDATYHAIVGENSPGARNFVRSALTFVTDPAFNTFAGNGVNKFLFVESQQPPPPGHILAANGMAASGYARGVDFEDHGASTLNAELDQLGTKYNAIVVVSDYGGNFSQAELDILNSRRNEITNFLAAGGGVIVGPQSNLGARLTPNGGWYGFLPFDVPYGVFSQLPLNASVTPFGASLGITNADINGNATHVVFNSTFAGLQPVTVDDKGRILTIAGRVAVAPTTIPEAGMEWGLVAVGAIALGTLIYNKQLRQRQRDRIPEFILPPSRL